MIVNLGCSPTWCYCCRSYVWASCYIVRINVSLACMLDIRYKWWWGNIIIDGLDCLGSTSHMNVPFHQLLIKYLFRMCLPATTSTGGRQYNKKEETLVVRVTIMTTDRPTIMAAICILSSEISTSEPVMHVGRDYPIIDYACAQWMDKGTEEATLINCPSC